MKRCQALALVLVNWRGVFYERYLLDGNVTALEGPNGAGKTTVMIAAYLSLMPDLKRLRFTNLGESGATGGDKGIWGRLGDPARPSYSAIRVRLTDNQEVVIGVLIERKAQPSVSLHPFIIRSMSASQPLSELFLVRGETHDSIPTAQELKANAKELGLDLNFSTSLKGYFRELFELGITPLRLGEEEDRNKYNEMLRTSMTGGISRALTSELRSFLLRQEGALSDTLSRMRSNLAACRRTRTEVSEARRLEGEISGILESGEKMVHAACSATEREAQDWRERCRALDHERTELSQRVNKQQAQQKGRDANEQRLLQCEDQLRQELAHLEDQLRLHLSSRKALQSRRELRNTVESGTELASQRGKELQSAVETRRQAHRLRDETQAAVARSAAGLADLQTGIDELGRKAASYRRAHNAWLALQAALSAPELKLEELPLRKVELKERLSDCDRQLALLDQQQHAGEGQQQQYQRAIDALMELTDAPLDDQEPQPLAEDQLSAYRRAAALAERRSELEEQLQRVAHQRDKQAEARAAACEARLEQTNWSSSSVLRRARQQEEELEGAEEELKQTEAEIKEAHRELERLSDAQRALARRQERYNQLKDSFNQLEASIQHTAREAGLSSALSELQGQERELRQRAERFAVERRQMLEQATQLESGSNHVSPELEALCDELGGELLLRRYDEVPPEQAPAIQAELGSWARAIVVADPEQAAKQVLSLEERPDDVWLVAPGGAALPQPAAGELTGTETQAEHEQESGLVVRSPEGLRVSKLPEHTTVGRDARQREARRLREAATRGTKTEEELQQRLSQVEAQSAVVLRLLQDRDAWEQGDRSEELALLAQEAQTHSERRDAQREFLEQLNNQLDQTRVQREHFRRLEPLAHWLDLPDQEPLLTRIAQQLADAEAAQREVQRARPHAEELARSLPALSSPPLSPEERAELVKKHESVSEARRQSFEALQLLDDVESQGAALSWKEAEASLHAGTDLSPELKQQHEGCVHRAEQAEQALAAAEQSWEAACGASQAADAELGAAQAHLSRIEEELRDLGLPDDAEPGGSSGEQQLQQQAAAAEARLKEAQDALKEHIASAAVQQERASQDEERLSEVDAELLTARGAAQPAEERLTRLEQRCHELGVRLPGASQDDTAALDPWADARAQASLLIDRLRGAAGGALLADELHADLSQSANPADSFLEAWEKVRTWLGKRLPTQISEGRTPSLALERLRSDLETLGHRLKRQEGDLKGASGDVARSIDVQIRRASSQVRRLNQYLTGVSFGSISSIRVQIGRVEKMARILEALRSGSAQELLFDSTLPIEQALDEVFRRYGGGGSGGTRLLDYREYVDLRVEVKRQADREWESANPTRVSTGEAIGVGAALMMVILSEWERDANLLRSTAPSGTLRFLFLDEANRLSQDNLSVLFDLCEHLELQLLIAAPEVAQAGGNTTYRLLRKVAEDGSEEVVVSGRRASLPEHATDTQEGVASSEAPTADPPPSNEPEPQPGPNQGVLIS